MDDPEHKNHTILLDHVVHHAVIADSEPMEGISRPLDGLDRLSTNPTLPCGFRRELLEGVGDALPDVCRELLEGSDGRGRQLDAVGFQASSVRLVVRPRA